MQESAINLAFSLISSGNPDLYEIIGLSLKVSSLAVLFALVFGLSIGASLAINQFHGKQVLSVLVNALMSLPPVVVGLMVYLGLSRSGPFGWLGLLYSPTAMIIAQTILITPLIAALSRQVLEDLYQEGLGRSLSEVGAVIIVGGNIDHLTRVMTTAIALETSKGDLPLALALGLILLAMALAINALLATLSYNAKRQAYA